MRSGRHVVVCVKFGLLYGVCSLVWIFLGTCQRLAGGRGVETGGGSDVFEALKTEGQEKMGRVKGRVMQIYARDHIEVRTLTEEKMSSIFGSKNNNKTLRYINCEVLTRI